MLRCGVASFSVLLAYLAPLYFGRTVDLSAGAVDVGGFFEGLAAGLGAALVCAGDFVASLDLAGDFGS